MLTAISLVKSIKMSSRGKKKSSVMSLYSRLISQIWNNDFVDSWLLYFHNLFAVGVVHQICLDGEIKNNVKNLFDIFDLLHIPQRTDIHSSSSQLEVLSSDRCPILPLSKYDKDYLNAVGPAFLLKT